jgi:DNA-binding cell septation regulator SpoVG
MTMNTETKKDKPYYYKLFRVRRDDGRVTTVSVDPVLVTHAVKVMGGLKPVGKFVREVALTYQDGQYKSCSGFVSLQLEREVSTRNNQRAITPAAAAAM